MPALPWSAGVYAPADGAQLHVLTSNLPLKRYRDIPRFLRWTMKIRVQLKTAPGCAGYTLDAKVFTKTFWTLSAWSDKDAMEVFVHSGVHAEMLKDMAGRLGNPHFVDSSATAADLPLSWPEARLRIQRSS
ncbi:hypothetical protein GPX89_06305 [Nocardia sp. ET3-3]|uniref:DUF3291 domain-containing protein n=1 Tax=Nocardia terrae TaxID=2675851 RepID=A0A7K1USH6_9NOCA|nr:hypothetical protein [Nocardia terrae]MVU76858.1 hypothetical protein [Nocardia terrae]